MLLKIMVFPVCYSDKHFVNFSTDNQHLYENSEEKVFGVLETFTILSYHQDSTCADPESFFRGGPLNFDNVFLFCFFVFLVDEGREDPNTTKSGPLLIMAHRKLAW